MEIRYSPEDSETIKSHETFESYTPRHETQSFAKEGLMALTKYMIENKGDFKEPAIIGIEGDPGLGKSHLLNAIKLELIKNNIPFSHNSDKYFLQNGAYKVNNIIILDDLFKNLKKIEELNSLDSKLTLEKIEEMIFDLYEKSKILIVSSNFNIKNILNKLSDGDEVGRLKDRITELLGHVQPIKIEGESYRVEKAKQISAITDIFDEVKSTYPNK